MSPSTATTPNAASELVPIAERLRYMQWFRVLLATVAGVSAWLTRDTLDAAPALVAGVTLAYLAVSFLTQLSWRLSRKSATRLFGIVLILDGVFLAWASYVTGGSGSPVRYLIVLHLIAVALLASYRTGMKLALWHSILLLCAYYGQDAELLRPLEEDSSLGIGDPFEQLLAFSVVFWLVAIVTSSFSAVNERELRRRRYDLEALAVMARRLEEAAGSADAADVLVDTVADTFDVERAAVLAAPGGEQLGVLASRGDVRDAGVHSDGDSVVRRAMTEHRTQLVTVLDPLADAALAAVLPDARNLVVVPLSAARKPLGVLVMEHPLRAASRIERRIVGMLERFGAHAALALRNAWLLEEIQQLAATDGLTGIANRTTFQRTLGQELARAERGDGSVGLVMLDLDHFKRLNDTYGHQAGDEVLRRVAGVLDECCRGFDTPARFGGEEFAVVLPHTDPPEARAVAERLRAAISAAPLDPKVTVSVGVASYPDDAASADDLVRAADEALYASKRAGRNRVSAAAASTRAGGGAEHINGAG